MRWKFKKPSGATAGGVAGAASGAIIKSTVPVASESGGVLRYAAFVARQLSRKKQKRKRQLSKKKLHTIFELD